jgi:hypothetical protein
MTKKKTKLFANNRKKPAKRFGIPSNTAKQKDLKTTNNASE